MGDQVLNNKEKNIGIFDSGLGGLTIVKPLIEKLPNENIVYFGDIARVPYGARSDKTILRYAIEDINFLKTKDIKMIIAACGTVSSVFFQNGINNLNFKDIFYTGIIETASEAAIRYTKTKKIAIIGTSATIRSQAYSIYIKSVNQTIETVSIACPLFVPMVEEGIFDVRPDIVTKVIEMYLEPLKKSDIDTLILGCTHYPLLKELILDYFDNKIKLVDPGIELAKFIKLYLDKNNLLNLKGGNKRFFINDGVNKFHKIANKFLKIDILKDLEVIDLFY